METTHVRTGENAPINSAVASKDAEIVDTDKLVILSLILERGKITFEEIEEALKEKYKTHDEQRVIYSKVYNLTSSGILKADWQEGMVDGRFRKWQIFWVAEEEKQSVAEAVKKLKQGNALLNKRS